MNDRLTFHIGVIAGFPLIELVCVEKQQRIHGSLLSTAVDSAACRGAVNTQDKCTTLGNSSLQRCQ